MGEGPKDLRDDAERYNAPRPDDVTGRSGENMTGRTLADADPSAPAVRAYDADVSRASTPGEDAANAGGTAETAAIRAEIEQKRADISGTIEEIQSRLSPRNVVSSATDATKERVRQFAGTASETASQVADRTREVAGQVADRTREMAGEVAGRTREVAGRTADRVRENPWPAVAMAAGVGAAAWWMMRRRGVDDYEELDVDDYSEESLYYDDFSATGGNRFVDVIRDHPIPTALTAIGVGLLIWNRAGSQHASYGTSDVEQAWGTEGDYGADAGSYRSFGEATWESADSTADRVRDAVSDAKDRARGAVSDAATRARGAMSGAAERARDRLSGVSSRTRQAARQTGNQLNNASRRAKTELEYWMERNPLAVGGAALALGLAVGLALPESHQEQRLMGSARDRLIDRAQDLAGQAVDKAQKVAGDVANKASEAMNKPQA
jgi:ElaB/YqjD/DUF883 family membrane-anchored ribosome-binding protein